MRFLVTLFAVVLIFASCDYKEGSGDIITENRNLTSFTAITVSGPFEVILTTGSPDKLVIEADDNLMEYVETQVRGNTLKINLSRKFNLRNAHLKAYISASSISSLKASAAADVLIKTELISANKVDLESSSGATIRGTIDAPRISGTASSGSKLDLKGRSRNLDLSSSSGASIQASELLAEYTTASSSSGATIRTFASIDLDASASSGGEVEYRGSSKVSRKESSGGSVKKAE